MKKALALLVVMVMLLALSTPVFAFGSIIGQRGGMPGAHGLDNMSVASETKGATAAHILGFLQ